MVVPGSEQVRRQAEAEGLDERFRAAGFEWRTAGCSMCLGMNEDTLSPGERCASTSNRNFEGRQGRGGRTHLVSPADGRRRRRRGPLRRHPELELSHGARQADQGAGRPCSTAPTSTRTRSSPRSSSSASSAPASASSCSTTGASSRAGTCRPTRSSPPARTSAAAPAASTRRGRCRTTASRPSCARSFADIFFTNCLKIGLLPVVLPEEDVRALMAGRRGRGRPRGARGPLRRPRRAVRDRGGAPPPPAQRPRRHRAHAAAGRRDRAPTSASASATGPVTTALVRARLRRCPTSSPCPATASAPRSCRAAARVLDAVAADLDLRGAPRSAAPRSTRTGPR